MQEQPLGALPCAGTSSSSDTAVTHSTQIASGGATMCLLPARSALWPRDGAPGGHTSSSSASRHGTERTWAAWGGFALSNEQKLAVDALQVGAWPLTSQKSRAEFSCSLTYMKQDQRCCNSAASGVDSWGRTEAKGSTKP